MIRSNVRQLAELAGQYGVQTAYYDVEQRRQTASIEALVHILRAMGAPIAGPDDAGDALRQRRQATWARLVEPVVVAWDAEACRCPLRCRADHLGRTLDCLLTLEDGSRQSWSQRIDELEATERRTVEGVAYVASLLPISRTLPHGYHRLQVSLGTDEAETLIIAAPRKAFQPPPGRARRGWGVFVPLYALHSSRSWGAGDYADLEALMDWVAELGGNCVATLPQLASFPNEPHGTSPYAPASRLFWDELYLDVERIAELSSCPAAQAMFVDLDVRRTIDELKRSPLVDYARQMSLKRRILEHLAAAMDGARPERREAFERFVADHPEIDRYARFRAAGEQRGEPWYRWPAALRDGRITPDDFDPRAWQYHRYVQWIADEQLRGLAARAQERQLTWYLDLPLGVHGAGYDVWRWRDVFAVGAHGGAPPDAVFTKGQDWGFPPLHPIQLREQGYRYWIDVLRHHLHYTGLLRIDHVMSLHRLYWVPADAEAKDGAYVRYPADELYAILALESHRQRAWIVGENLGTVPKSVDASMRRHGVHGMYVLQYQLQSSGPKAVASVPQASVASLNTHDMPPFEAFRQGSDIADRRDLDLLSDEAAVAEREERQQLIGTLTSWLQKQGLLADGEPQPSELGCAALLWLAKSRAAMLLVNLEDLWLETSPQNTPGTTSQRPNWRRKLRYDFETLCRLPQVVDVLCEINRARSAVPPSFAATESAPAAVSENLTPR